MLRAFAMEDSEAAAMQQLTEHARSANITLGDQLVYP